MKQVSVRFPDDLHARLKRECFEAGESINDVVIRAIKYEVGVMEVERVGMPASLLGRIVAVLPPGCPPGIKREDAEVEKMREAVRAGRDAEKP